MPTSGRPTIPKLSAGDVTDMLDVPIVDSHLHLWDPRRFRMPWIDDNAHLRQPFGLAEFSEHSQGLAVEAMVYLQVDVTPSYGLLEATWAVEQAERDSRLAGIVAWAPLEDGRVATSYLDALTKIGKPLKGIRRLMQAEADPDFPIRADLLDGVRLLPKYGLSFDICIRHDQLARTIDMVRACPETAFVLDHLGGPDVKNHRLEPWRAQIAELAEFSNVVCKVSGVVSQADHDHWTPADVEPYVSHVLAVFGEDRVLFGGDWPVVTLAASYRRWVSTLDDLTSNLQPDARRKLWADNARRVYRL
jgi:L-fuconolactonase